MQRAKLHAPGRPSGALVLTLNVILPVLSFGRWRVAPSGGEELLLLDNVADTRLSLDFQREIGRLFCFFVQFFFFV